MIYTLLLRPMIGRQLDALNEMENFLFQDCQDINFTVVRPPGLTDGPLSGMYFLIIFYVQNHACCKFIYNRNQSNLFFSLFQDAKIVEGVDQYFFSDGQTARRTPRANVAKYMLDILDSNQHSKKGLSIDLEKV